MGMNQRMIEPRTVLWARAEVSWQNPAGQWCIARATLEDTSPSGACVRVDRPFEIGSRITVKWHREQFAAIARNCRSDGWEFLLGVQREKASRPIGTAGNGPAAKAAIEVAGVPVRPAQPAQEQRREIPAAQEKNEQPTNVQANEAEVVQRQVQEPKPKKQALVTDVPVAEVKSGLVRYVASQFQSRRQSQSASCRRRRFMESKGRFSKFWRSEEAAVIAEPTAKQPAVNAAATVQPAVATTTRGELLSYEDIYRAAGILGSRPGYDISKVVEMLHCERMRGLPDDVRRTSVLMAIEAAGTPVEELLREARERERALDAYEASQQRHMQEFEARKAEENGQIEAEMERVTAHYAERIKANLAQIAREKDSLHNWQMAKQGESQRITEVIELCSQTNEPRAMAASARSNGAGINSSGPSLVSGGLTTRPN
jgi:hypothetical protein